TATLTRAPAAMPSRGHGKPRRGISVSSRSGWAPSVSEEMIKSMTGFAAVTREDDRATIAVTIRSLNHRHLDLQLRVPQALAAIESDLRTLVAKRIARGRVELSVSVQIRQTPGVDVEFNEEFGDALSSALDQARA